MTICELCKQEVLKASSWSVIDLINTTSQVIMALAAVIAIIITIRQIRHRGRPNLKLSYKCGMSLYKHTDSEEYEVIAGVNVKVINLGLSPVYIEYCGLQFKNKKRHYDGHGIMTQYNIAKINPGESFDGTIPHVELLLDELDSKVSLHDKTYISVQLCNGKMHKTKTDYDYASFKHEFLQVAKRAKEENERN